eukprot:scaffold93489_cov27-Tisochrysis_lutea.AAC.1
MHSPRLIKLRSVSLIMPNYLNAQCVECIEAAHIARTCGICGRLAGREAEHKLRCCAVLVAFRGAWIINCILCVLHIGIFIYEAFMNAMQPASCLMSELMPFQAVAVEGGSGPSYSLPLHAD